MLGRGEISSEELVKSQYERIEEVEPKVDAYLTLDRDNAIARAIEIDKFRAGKEKLPALAGIPVGVKDNISTKGIRTTCASKMLENYVPVFNATVVEKLKKNGAVITGKLNMDEFAMGSSTENSYFKKTKTRLMSPAFPEARPAVLPQQCLPVKQS